MDKKYREFYKNAPIPFVVLRTVSNEIKMNIETDSQDRKQDFVKDFTQGHIIEDANQAFCDRVQMKYQEILGRELSEITRGECKDEFTFFIMEDGYLGAICMNSRQTDWQESAMNHFLKVNTDMLCVCKIDGTIQKANQKFEKVLGHKAEELEGKNIFTLVHPDDLEQTLQVRQLIVNARKDIVFIARFRCKNKSYKYLEWHVELVNGIEVYASARDITEKVRLEEQLRRLAVRDELTGLYNRHYLDTIIEAHMEQADRYNKYYSMALLDLDHFKDVNDTWGHPVGDEILKQTAAVILGMLRSSDILIRFGGEEFMLLLPQTELKGALEVAEKIREGIEAIEHPTVGKRTISIGVAERMRYESFHNWYRRVDYALYQAKENGRNKVVAVDDITGAPEVTINLTWRSQWESGNSDIDKQHRMLIEDANTLITMSIEQHNRQDMQKQIDKIVATCESHFAFEEGVLEIRHYPKVAEHIEIHKKLLTKAIKLKKAYERGTVRPTAFFSFLVDDVVLGHLLEEDIKFFPYVEEKGTKKKRS